MSMGLGHNYLVQILSRKTFDSFDEAVEYVKSCVGGFCEIRADIKYDKVKKKCYFSGSYYVEHLKIS